MPRTATAASADWVRHAEPTDGVERIEAWFQGKAYAMHRHDTYAIGRTLAGVQSFHYRRGRRDSLPGNTMVLHPDEAHDGQAGTDEGFRYRMIYVAPALIQDVLGGRALPFVEGGVTRDPRIAAATESLLLHAGNTLAPLDPLEQSDGLAELAQALAAVTGMSSARDKDVKGDYLAALRARDYLHANVTRVVTLDDIAAATGRDRWSLSHDFRTFYGTSPYRYLTMRRLDAVRRLMLAGVPLSSAAVDAGFADQSHMHRHFLKTFGITPGRWLQIAGNTTRNTRR